MARRSGIKITQLERGCSAVIDSPLVEFRRSKLICRLKVECMKMATQRTTTRQEESVARLPLGIGGCGGKIMTRGLLGTTGRVRTKRE